jgi:hypothetical protein
MDVIVATKSFGILTYQTKSDRPVQQTSHSKVRRRVAYECITRRYRDTVCSPLDAIRSIGSVDLSDVKNFILGSDNPATV